MDFLMLRIRFYKFLSRMIERHPRWSRFIGVKDSEIYFFSFVHFITFMASGMLFGLSICLLNAVHVFHMAWWVALLIIVGSILLSVFSISFLVGIFSYRKLLDTTSLRRLKDKLAYMDQEQKNVLIEWQSKHLTLREYHQHALNVLEALRHQEKLNSRIIDEHRAFAEHTGAAQLYEQRQLQKSIPQTQQMTSVKRL